MEAGSREGEGPTHMTGVRHPRLEGLLKFERKRAWQYDKVWKKALIRNEMKRLSCSSMNVQMNE